MFSRCIKYMYFLLCLIPSVIVFVLNDHFTCSSKQMRCVDASWGNERKTTRTYIYKQYSVPNNVHVMNQVHVVLTGVFGKNN